MGAGSPRRRRGRTWRAWRAGCGACGRGRRSSPAPSTAAPVARAPIRKLRLPSRCEPSSDSRSGRASSKLSRSIPSLLSPAGLSSPGWIQGRTKSPGRPSEPYRVFRQLGRRRTKPGCGSSAELVWLPLSGSGLAAGKGRQVAHHIRGSLGGRSIQSGQDARAGAAPADDKEWIWKIPRGGGGACGEPAIAVVGAVAATAVMAFGVTSAQAAVDVHRQLRRRGAERQPVWTFDILEPPDTATMTGTVEDTTGAVNVPNSGFRVPGVQR